MNKPDPGSIESFRAWLLNRQVAAARELTTAAENTMGFSRGNFQFALLCVASLVFAQYLADVKKGAPVPDPFEGLQ